jgi:hypothetical protein
MDRMFKHVEVTVSLLGGDTVNGIALDDPTKCGKFWTIYPDINNREVYTICQVSQINKVEVTVIYEEVVVEDMGV